MSTISVVLSDRLADAHQKTGATLRVGAGYRTYGAIIARGKDPVEGLKDMRLALATADARIVPMPVASLIRDHFVEAVARGNGDAD